MQRILVGILACALAFPLAASHTFNHEDRHEACEVYGAPQSHFIGDGHAHTHDPDVGATMHDHDPCKQTRMDYPGYENKAPLSEILPPAVELAPEELLFSDGDPANTEVFVGGEAYRFPVPEDSFKRQSNLVVLSDLQAEGMGFPGQGTYEDPYIIENYLIRGNLVLKDTDACFVLRNNVIVDRAAVAPLLPDPEGILRLADLDPHYEALKAAAEELRQTLLDEAAALDAMQLEWDAERAVWDAQAQEMEERKGTSQAEEVDKHLQRDYVQAARTTERLAERFDAYVAKYSEAAEPDREYAPLIDYDKETVQDLDALRLSFEAYQQDVDGDGAADDIEGWILGNPPPEEDPAADGAGSDEGKGKNGKAGGAKGDGAAKANGAWEAEKRKYDRYVEDLEAAIAQFDDLVARHDAARASASQEDQAFQDEYDAFRAAYEAFVAEHEVVTQDHVDFDTILPDLLAAPEADIAKADAHLELSAQWLFRYTGELGDVLYNEVSELADFVFEVLFGILDLLDPNNVAQNQGRLTLDWNGQCIHAYNNVAYDLRVNQNNDRTGYATGGILEDNRFYTIGQIRHYDGIFRENEVGNRAHLWHLADPSFPAPAGRTVNNDGANQGWYYDNVFYGQIDLDFHGHHHSAGFFAPSSHYHGSTKTVAYMQKADGTCTATHHSIDHSKANGPHEDYPTDNNIEIVGETVVDLPDAMRCLPHMDHGKRWTSVFFNDNLVIDPAGVGLRFEDRNHRADDEQANSENMRELKQPHFHQKWVQMEDNVVVGKIFIDVLNAAGTDLWSDDWSAVQSPAGPARTAEALSHPGAEIVNSHPYRNDAWLDINRNTVFQTQSVGILVADADDMTLFQLKGNRGLAVPVSFEQGPDPASLLAWLKASGTASADALAADLAAWGGQDRGVQTFASLHHVRDAFRVEQCGNVARGLDRGFIATDRIADDGKSIIKACGQSDWGSADPAVDIRYTPYRAPAPSPTQPLRDATADTDDFYVSELAFDTVDAAAKSLP